jgi:hypothetical protein
MRFGVRNTLVCLSLLFGIAGGVWAAHKDQPYAGVRMVQVTTWTDWTNSVGGYSSFTSCSWGSTTLYCGQNMEGPRSVYHAAMTATGGGWDFEIGCVAKWRWDKCGPLRPGSYSVEVKGTDMVFKNLINGVDYNKHYARTYHILSALPVSKN